MTNTVIVTDLTPFDAIGLKYELEKAGLLDKRDFTWSYRPIKYDDGWSSEISYRSQVAFEFVNPALASFYQLKWTK